MSIAETAQLLHEKGLSYRQIGRDTGLGRHKVRRMLDPDRARRESKRGKLRSHARAQAAQEGIAKEIVYERWGIA